MNFVTHLDGLSMLFGLLITGIGTLGVIYSIYYLATEQFILQFYIYLLLFMGSMIGVVFSDNLMVLYVFCDLTSISSFLLIAFSFCYLLEVCAVSYSLIILWFYMCIGN